MKKIKESLFESLILGSTLRSVQNEHISTWKAFQVDEILRIHGPNDKGVSILHFIKEDPTSDLLSLDFYIEIYCEWNKKKTKLKILEVKSNVKELTYNGHRIVVSGNNDIKIKKDKK